MILEELLRCVGFDAADRARLTELHRRLAPELPAIADRFYAAIAASPGASAVLGGPAQVERLRVTLIDWMSTGLLGPHDHAFNEKRARIGRRHVQIGLAQHYMFTAMNVVRVAYLDRIAALYPAAEVMPVVRSVDKLLDIELALMLRHYQLDSEDRLVQRERQIQRDRVAALQTLSAGLAHEVRNPLNAARLQLELLERRLRRAGGDARVLDPVGLANHEIQRLTQLLNEFLAFAGGSALHAEDHDVVAVIRHVLELERPLAERSATELTLDPSPDVAIAAIDPGKLHQICQNLVRNGIEAAPSGHVTVGVELDDADLRVRVRDDGPGIPPEVRARIYEPFFSTKPAGTGMGMAIVHNFVALHGGHVDLATSERGTEVTVVLPRRARA